MYFLKYYKLQGVKIMKQQRDPAQPSWPAQPDILWRPLWILEIYLLAWLSSARNSNVVFRYKRRCYWLAPEPRGTVKWYCNDEVMKYGYNLNLNNRGTNRDKFWTPDSILVGSPCPWQIISSFRCSCPTWARGSKSRTNLTTLFCIVWSLFFF